MKSGIGIGITTLVALFLVCPALATTWYCSPNGSSSNAGTQQSPWDIKSALLGNNGQVQAGDTIYLMDGVYYYTADPSSWALT